MWRLSFVGLAALVALAGCTFTTTRSNPDASDVVDAPVPDAPFVLTCPIGYGPINGVGMYRVVEITKQTWQAAAGDCNDDDATGGPYSGFTHLAVLGNETERLTITDTGTSIPGNSWIGLSDSAIEGTYRWVTAEDTGVYPMVGMEPPWDTDDPDDNNGNEDCIRFKSSFVLEDKPCTDVLSYVCECDAFPSR